MSWTDTAACRMAGTSLQSEYGEIVSLSCKEWKCRICGPRNAWRWRLRVSRMEFKLMLLLTNVPEDQVKARQGWTKLWRALKKHGCTEYLRVMELGPEHGMRHWHVLTTGVPFVSVWWLSRLAQESGLGKIVYSRRVYEISGAVDYLLGYVFKSLGVPDERKKAWRAVTCSRGVPNASKALARAYPFRNADKARWSVAGYVDDDVPYTSLDELRERLVT